MAPDTALKLQDLGSTAGKEKILASMTGLQGNGKTPRKGKGQGKGGQGRANRGTIPLAARTPLERAQALVTSLLKEANTCRDCSFKLRPLKVSTSLVSQLGACDVKLRELAKTVQEKVNAKENTNGAYAPLIEKVRFCSLNR